MGQRTGILGQVDVTLNSDTPLYTVPEEDTVHGKVFVSERGGATADIRIWLRKDGDASSNEHYIVYDETITANASKVTAPFFVEEGDIVMVRATTGDVSFTLVGEP